MLCYAAMLAFSRCGYLQALIPKHSRYINNAAQGLEKSNEHGTGFYFICIV